MLRQAAACASGLAPLAALSGNRRRLFSASSCASSCQTRGVEAVIPATRFGPTEPPGREHWRVIGAKDIDGKGTAHALHALDPWLFLDESLNPSGAGGLGMGRHPHAGFVVFTYLAKGALQPWDNFDGVTPVNTEGGVYMLNSGKGAVHEEANISKDGMHQLQLWMNLGLDEQPPASKTLFQPSEIPVRRSPGQFVRVIVGEALGMRSPVQAPAPCLYVHVGLEAGRALELPVPGKLRGFVYVIKGAGHVGDTAAAVGPRDCAILRDSANDATLGIEAGDGGLEFIMAVAAPTGRPAYNILGHGGALFSSSEEGAREAMRRFEDQREAFGKL